MTASQWAIISKECVLDCRECKAEKKPRRDPTGLLLLGFGPTVSPKGIILGFSPKRFGH